jgi:hypothetical protein
VYEFKVRWNTSKIKPALIHESRNFVTRNKIRLGLTEKQLENKLGPPMHKSVENGITIWKYGEKGKDELYFGRYDFEGGRLIQFWFGEAYP